MTISRNTFGRTGPMTLYDWIRLWVQGELRIWVNADSPYAPKNEAFPSIVVIQIDKEGWEEILNESYN